MHAQYVPPPVFLSIEESCVSYCREWKMPFTLWYGRSGCTGSISSARKKRLRAVSSLKSVLWCEMGKCMQPRTRQLCVCVVSGNLWRKALGENTEWELVLHMLSKLTCWFLLGLWWGSNRRLKRLLISSLFLFLCIVVDYYLRPFSHWVHLWSLIITSIDPSWYAFTLLWSSGYTCVTLSPRRYRRWFSFP